jgi:hypothetical protein
MTTSSWVMTVGVRLHGLALARAAAMSAIPAATATVSTMSATALAACEDFPAAVETAPKAAATHRPAASITWAAAARRSAAGVWDAGRTPASVAAGTSGALGLAGVLGLAGPRGLLACPAPLARVAISHTTLGSQLRRRLALSECEAS